MAADHFANRIIPLLKQLDIRGANSEDFTSENLDVLTANLQNPRFFTRQDLAEAWEIEQNKELDSVFSFIGRSPGWAKWANSQHTLMNTRESL